MSVLRYKALDASRCYQPRIQPATRPYGYTPRHASLNVTNPRYLEFDKESRTPCPGSDQDLTRGESFRSSSLPNRALGRGAPRDAGRGTYWEGQHSDLYWGSTTLMPIWGREGIRAQVCNSMEVSWLSAGQNQLRPPDSAVAPGRAKIVVPRKASDLCLLLAIVTTAAGLRGGALSSRETL